MKTLKFYSTVWKVNIVVVVLMALMFILIPAILVENLMNIQFSNSFMVFKELVKNPVLLRTNFYYDFVFIIAYSSLFFYSIKVFDYTLSLNLKPWFYVLCFIPGLFDSLENLCGLYLLDAMNKNNSPVFGLFYWFTRIKWTLLIFFMLSTVTISFFYFLGLLKSFLDYMLSLKSGNM